MKAFAALVALLLAGLLATAWLVMVTVATSDAVAAVRAAGLEARDLMVEIDADPLSLLLGQARHVRIHAKAAAYQGFTIGTLDLGLADVGLARRSCASVSGSASDISHQTALLPLRFTGADVGGTCAAMTLTLRLDTVQAQTLAASAIAQVTEGVPQAIVLSPPAELDATLGGAVLHGRILMDQTNGVSLRLEDIAQHIAFTIPLLDGQALSPLSLQSAGASADGILIQAGLDPRVVLP